MKLKITLLILAVLVLAAFAPQFSQSATAIICRFEASPCVTSWNGNDIYLYSDAGSTQKMLLEGSAGSITQAGFHIISAQTAISVTNGGVVTPTGSYQPLESGGAVTATLSSGCTAGQQVTFINTVNQSIIISETATSALSGNATLGQYDAMKVLCDGTRWVQIAPESDN